MRRERASRSASAGSKARGESGGRSIALPSFENSPQSVEQLFELVGDVVETEAAERRSHAAPPLGWDAVGVRTLSYSNLLQVEEAEPMIARRRMLEIAAGCAAVFSLGGAGRAAALPRTPRQTAGPFYPLSIPADSDNDLVRIAGHDGAAKGTIAYVSGRVLDVDGRPL